MEDIFSNKTERDLLVEPHYATNATPFSSKPILQSGTSQFVSKELDGNKFWWMSDVIKEMNDHETVHKVKEFAEFCSNWIDERGITSAYNFSAVMQACKLYDVQHLKKEKEELTVLVALWVVFLRAMKVNINGDGFYKYDSLESFLNSYEGSSFEKLEISEQMRLFETANWMSILLPMLVAKKSKGLVLQVIPKLLEGFGVKYVTGSGQSKATSNRVRIFEQEGNVQPCKKRKWGIGKSDAHDSDESPKVHHKKRERGTERGAVLRHSLDLGEAAHLPDAPAVPAGLSRAAAAWAVQIEKERSGDDFAKPDLEKFRRESFFSGPTLLRRDWSEDYSHHFDIDIDQLL
jgi:hypothetical protein